MIEVLRMKKILGFILVLAMVCSVCIAANAEEELRWTYPVSLTEIQSEYTILVNAMDKGVHKLDSKYKPSPIVKVTGVKRATSAAVQMQETAANALKEMFAAAADVTEYTYTKSNGTTETARFSGGMILYLKSGYRSYQTQKTTYANHLEKNNGKDDGYVAKPGASEHQTGLCADILNHDYAGRPLMTQDFKWTPEAQWMKENCAEYGFILRFTEDGEKQTGIEFEPWHFRYVGVEVATYIMKKGITLEEFTVEANQAIEDFVNAGGSVEKQLAYEVLHSSGIPESYVTDECGTDGDPEVSILY